MAEWVTLEDGRRVYGEPIYGIDGKLKGVSPRPEPQYPKIIGTVSFLEELKTTSYSDEPWKLELLAGAVCELARLVVTPAAAPVSVTSPLSREPCPAAPASQRDREELLQLAYALHGMRGMPEARSRVELYALSLIDPKIPAPPVPLVTFTPYDGGQAIAIGDENYIITGEDDADMIERLLKAAGVKVQRG